MPTNITINVTQNENSAPNPTAPNPMDTIDAFCSASTPQTPAPPTPGVESEAETVRRIRRVMSRSEQEDFHRIRQHGPSFPTGTSRGEMLARVLLWAHTDPILGGFALPISMLMEAVFANAHMDTGEITGIINRARTWLVNRGHRANMNTALICTLARVDGVLKIVANKTEFDLWLEPSIQTGVKSRIMSAGRHHELKDLLPEGPQTDETAEIRALSERFRAVLATTSHDLESLPLLPARKPPTR